MKTVFCIQIILIWIRIIGSNYQNHCEKDWEIKCFLILSPSTKTGKCNNFLIHLFVVYCENVSNFLSTRRSISWSNGRNYTIHTLSMVSLWTCIQWIESPGPENIKFKIQLRISKSYITYYIIMYPRSIKSK